MASGRKGGRAQLDPGDTPVCSAPPGEAVEPRQGWARAGRHSPGGSGLWDTAGTCLSITPAPLSPGNRNCHSGALGSCSSPEQVCRGTSHPLLHETFLWWPGDRRLSLLLYLQPLVPSSCQQAELGYCQLWPRVKAPPWCQFRPPGPVQWHRHSLAICPGPTAAPLQREGGQQPPWSLSPAQNSAFSQRQENHNRSEPEQGGEEQLKPPPGRAPRATNRTVLCAGLLWGPSCPRA